MRHSSRHAPPTTSALLLDHIAAQEAAPPPLPEKADSANELLTVQNAAKTIAVAHGTELEHLRQNASFDHSLRAEVESLRQHNSEMTDALSPPKPAPPRQKHRSWR